MEFPDELHGQRLVLRRTAPKWETAQSIFAAVDSDREHLEPWFPWAPMTRKSEDTMKYLFDKEDDTGKVEYGIYIDGSFAGTIAVMNIDTEARAGELGYWLSSSFTRKGYMTEAVRTIEKAFFGSLGFNRLFLKCDSRNKASQGVARKCGYAHEGTHRQDEYSTYFGDLRNTMYFSKLQEEYKNGKDDGPQ